MRSGAERRAASPRGAARLHELDLTALDEHDVASPEDDREPAVRSDRSRSAGAAAHAHRVAAKGVPTLERVRKLLEAAGKPVRVTTFQPGQHGSEQRAAVELPTGRKS